MVFFLLCILFAHSCAKTRWSTCHSFCTDRADICRADVSNDKKCVSVNQQRRLFKFRSSFPPDPCSGGPVCFGKAQRGNLKFKLLLIPPVMARGARDACTYSNTSALNVFIFLLFLQGTDMKIVIVK